MNKNIVLGAIASVGLLLSACSNPAGEQIGQLALVGGALHGCSSMATSDCDDWETYRATVLGDLDDSKIRTPVILGVSLDDNNIYDVIDDSVWDTNVFFADAVEEILFELQSTLTGPDYLYGSWDEFRTAFVDFGDTSVSDADGIITGNDLWFNTSDAQYSTLDRLRIVDDTFQYTVSGTKVDAILALQTIAALNADVFDGLSTALNESIYSSPVSQDALVDYFSEINLVDASVNGWKLYKKYLSDDEYDFLIATLDPEDDGTFTINSTNITTIENDVTVDNGGDGWDEYNRDDLMAVLTHLLSEAGADITYVTKSAMRSAIISTYLDGSDQSVSFYYELGIDIWDSLSTVEQTLVLQGLVDPLVDYIRPIEYVDLDGSSDASTVDVLTAIVAKAKGDSSDAPKFLIMTSSSNDSYDAVDYYVSIFNQAGADAQWLPIDRAYQDARALERCDLLDAIHADYASNAHVNLLYSDYSAAHNDACNNPQSVLDLIESADALFINGGGQRRSLDALMPAVDGERVDSVEMALIRKRFEANELLIGGTSAGTAVQGGGYLNDGSAVNPMIDGGTAHDVLVSGYDDGIAVFEGGLGLFNYGITDTHFSERARETRLVKLAQQTDVQFGFGVDETTALMIDKYDNEGSESAHMNVVGKSGVFITDLGNANVNSGDEDTLDIEQVSIHYIREGDIARVDAESAEISIFLAGERVALDAGAEEVTNSDVLYEDNFRDMATDFVATGASVASGISYEVDPAINVNLSRHESTEAAKQGDLTSYTNVLMSITPQ